MLSDRRIRALKPAHCDQWYSDGNVLIQAVKRNLARFPPDFMFQLTASEWAGLRSQIVTSTVRRGGRRYPPYAFTEQGVAMLSSVLGSYRAIAVNIQIMRAFVRMREMLITSKELAQKLDQLEARLEKKLVEEDFSRLPIADFWPKMQAAKWVHPIDQNGKLRTFQEPTGSPGEIAR
jgi:hypothetical protein